LGSGGHRKLITVCIHDFTMSHLGSNGKNIENIDLSLSEILTVYLVDRLYLSVAVTGDKCCIFNRIQGAIEN